MPRPAGRPGHMYFNVCSQVDQRCFHISFVSPAAEKSLAEYRDRLPQNVIDEINNAVADVRGVMESENPEASMEWWFVVRIG